MRANWSCVPPWLCALALACGCGRESLSREVDAAVDRPMAIPTDEPDAFAADDAQDGAIDARTRDTRGRDTPIDAPPDGPCQPGFGLCPAGAAGTCTDQRTDQNCGACGRVCQTGTRCADGACVSVCPAGTSYCPGIAGNGCVNLAASPDHCGRCGLSCGAGQVCQDALCQPSCRATLAWDLPEITLLPSASGSLTMGDLDGDGARDFTLAIRNSYEVWRNQRNGRFQPWTAALPILDASERVARAGMGDFDGDGRADLLLGLYQDTSNSYVGSYLLFTATAAGDFRRAGSTKLASNASTTTWAVTDMNRDGRSDLVTFEEKQVVVWLGQTDGRLLESGKATAPSRLYYPLLADVNGDGHTDALAVTSNQLELHVFLGTGSGQISPAVVTTLTEERIPRAVTDLDGDGMFDLVASTDTNAVLMRANQDGRFVDARILEEDSPVVAAVFVDLNKDGKLDFVRSVGDDELRISHGNGDGGFGAPQRYAYPDSTMLFVEDYDGDGRLDLALHSTRPRSLLVFKGRDGSFPGARLFAEDQGMAEGAVWSGTVAVRADLNQDGIPDTAKPITSQSVIEVTLGGADAGQPTISYPAASLSSLMAIDVDLDGHQDLVFPSLSNGTVTILLGRGDGSFDQRLSVLVVAMKDDVIGFSPPRPGRGRDLLFKRADAPIGVLASTSRLCP